MSGDRSTAFALVVWCEADFCWGSIAVSLNREVIEGLAARLALCLPAHPCRVIEAASIDDDAVEVSGHREPWPDHVAGLHHEAYGVQ